MAPCSRGSPSATPSSTRFTAAPVAHLSWVRCSLRRHPLWLPELAAALGVLVLDRCITSTVPWTPVTRMCTRSVSRASGARHRIITRLEILGVHDRWPAWYPRCPSSWCSTPFRDILEVTDSCWRGMSVPELPGHCAVVVAPARNARATTCRPVTGSSPRWCHMNESLRLSALLAHPANGACVIEGARRRGVTDVSIESTAAELPAEELAGWRSRLHRCPACGSRWMPSSAVPAIMDSSRWPCRRQNGSAREPARSPHARADAAARRTAHGAREGLCWHLLEARATRSPWPTCERSPSRSSIPQRACPTSCAICRRAWATASPSSIPRAYCWGRRQSRSGGIVVDPAPWVDLARAAAAAPRHPCGWTSEP